MSGQPFHATQENRLSDHYHLLIALAPWCFVQLFSAVCNHTPIDPSAWYHVGFAEGGMIYARMPKEASCRTSIAETTETCLPGTELLR